MARLNFKHSEDWVEKLLMIQELSPSERQPLLEHVASCATCEYILNEYFALRKQARLLLNKSVPGVSKGLPPRLLEMWQEEGEMWEDEDRNRERMYEVEYRNSIIEPVLIDVQTQKPLSLGDFWRKLSESTSDPGNEAT